MAPIPTWLSAQPNMGELRRYSKGLPGQFDTSGVESNYNGMMANNVARGTAQAGAAASAAQNRAFRTGGQVASSFAQGSAMLPVLDRNRQMAGDLAQYKGGMQAQMSGNQLDAAKAMAQLRMQQLGLRSGFQMDQNRLDQGGSQFNADLGFRNKQLEQSGDQFDKGYGLQRDAFDMQSQAQMFAQQQALMRPKMANYNVDLNGRPMSIADGQRMASVQSNGGYEGGGGMSYGGGGGLGMGRTQAPSKMGMMRNRANAAVSQAMRGFNIF